MDLVRSVVVAVNRDCVEVKEDERSSYAIKIVFTDSEGYRVTLMKGGFAKRVDARAAGIRKIEEFKGGVK